MLRLEGAIREYAWGSRTAIAEFLGRDVPAPEPQAELWLGAHPGDPAVLVTADGQRRSLLDAIEAAPQRLLGDRVLASFGPRLPFLLKVLAAAAPLSLQAHPSPEQASAGYAAEEAAGVPRDAPHRLYKDDSAKPELICALDRFEGLCGFREPTRTLELARALDVPQLSALLRPLETHPDADGLRDVFGALMTMSTGPLLVLLDAVVGRIGAGAGDGNEQQASLQWVVRLAEAYPGDPGVIASLLLNHVTLQPGEALYLPAGNLHAYLEGVGIEVMANSDNVLRGGLTPKHVAVDALLQVLRFDPSPVRVLLPDGDPEMVYRTPAAEFRLSLLRLSEWKGFTMSAGLPQILLCVDGEAALVPAGERSLTLVRGQAAFVAASDPPVTVAGDGSLFRATVGE